MLNLMNLKIRTKILVIPLAILIISNILLAGVSTYVAQMYLNQQMVQDGELFANNALENYRRMKGIPVPNYTINKGMLAENMATAAVEYPFTLAENMVGRPEEL